MTSESEQRKARRLGNPVRLVVVVSLMALGLAPFFVQHLINLYRYRPHYEFAPVVLLAFAWLIWQRWPQQIRHSWASRLAGSMLVLSGLAVLAIALVFYSPWAGAVAAVLAVGGLLVLSAGHEAFLKLAPIWLLLWLVIPPPFRFDFQLIRMLQGVTSRSSTLLLESVGVYHVVEGNVFCLPNRELFVAEACSGIHSQLVLIAASILLVIMFRRTWLHAILLVATSVCFSALINTVRVTLVVFVAAGWDLHWSDGWRHALLGYALTLVGFLLLISSDLLLAGLLAPVLDLSNSDDDLSPEGLPLATDFLSRIWNRMIACVTAADEIALGEDLDSSSAGSPSQRDAVAGPGRGPATTFFWLFLLPVAVAFGCLGIIQVLVLAQVSENGAIRLGTVGTQLQQGSLPTELDGWQCVEYRTEERETGSDAGQFSRIWIYESDDQKTRLSAEFPFLGWHELTNCYTSIGWIEVSRTVWRHDRLGPFVEVTLCKPAGEVGHLCFSDYDGAGRPVEPRVMHWTGWQGKLAQSPVWPLFGVGTQTVLPSETTIQFQQFFVSQFDIGDEQQQEIRNLYLDFRRQFVERGWRAQEGDRR